MERASGTEKVDTMESHNHLVPICADLTVVDAVRPDTFAVGIVGNSLSNSSCSLLCFSQRNYEGYFCVEPGSPFECTINN